MTILFNKRAGEKILSPWWLFMLVIVGVSIVIGVAILSSIDVDAREYEANILIERLAICSNQGGVLNPDFMRDNFNVYEECGLKESTFSDNFYFRISLTEKTGEVIKEVRGGDYSMEKDCLVVKGSKIESKNYPKCNSMTEDIIYFKEGEKKEVKISIFASSNQRGVLSNV